MELRCRKIEKEGNRESLWHGFEREEGGGRKVNRKRRNIAEIWMEAEEKNSTAN